MYACISRKVELVQLLLSHTGAQGLSEKSRKGQTASHVAASGWSICNQVVKVLLLAGADPSITDDKGRTPRQVAERQMEWHLAHMEAFEVSCTVPQYY